MTSSPVTRGRPGLPLECHTERALIGVSQGQRHSGHVEPGIAEQFFGTLDTLAAQPYERCHAHRLPEGCHKVADRQTGDRCDLTQRQIPFLEAVDHELAGTAQRSYGKNTAAGCWGWPHRYNERLDEVRRQENGRRLHVTGALTCPVDTIVVNGTCNLPAERVRVIPHSGPVERRQAPEPRTSQHEVLIELHQQRFQVERGPDFPLNRGFSGQHQGVPGLRQHRPWAARRAALRIHPTSAEAEYRLQTTRLRDRLPGGRPDDVGRGTPATPLHPARKAHSSLNVPAHSVGRSIDHAAIVAAQARKGSSSRDISLTRARSGVIYQQTR